MNSLLLDLIGAIGFQLNDTLTTFLGVRAGAGEGNFIFKFLSNGRIRDFAVVGILKVLLPIIIYLFTLTNPEYIAYLIFDFYLEVGVTLWNIYMLYEHKFRR